MKETRIKILIVALSLFIILDPSIEKIKSGKKYLHNLFSESFADEELPDSIKTIRKINSFENAFRYK
jgi:hypothetical protein